MPGEGEEKVSDVQLFSLPKKNQNSSLYMKVGA